MLEHNPPQMKTLVETFLIEETTDLIYDVDKLEKWHSHVTELGLTGQTQIVKPNKSPIPFMHMKQEVVNMFKVLCPATVAVNEYSLTPIPLEILDLVALSKNEKYFDMIQIWFDNKSPDPLCVGLTYQNEEDRVKGYSWRMNHYLIGKWYDVKQSFEELKERAAKRYKAQERNRLEQQIVTYQRDLEDLDRKTIDFLGTDTSLPF